MSGLDNLSISCSSARQVYVDIRIQFVSLSWRAYHIILVFRRLQTIATPGKTLIAYVDEIIGPHAKFIIFIVHHPPDY
jgi:hypothetical protein